MTLAKAKAALKAANLPKPFTPRGIQSGKIAVNVNRDQMVQVQLEMIALGFEQEVCFNGVDTDYQIIFKR